VPRIFLSVVWANSFVDRLESSTFVTEIVAFEMRKKTTTSCGGQNKIYFISFGLNLKIPIRNSISPIITTATVTASRERILNYGMSGGFRGLILPNYFPTSCGGTSNESTRRSTFRNVSIHGMTCKCFFESFIKKIHLIPIFAYDKNAGPSGTAGQQSAKTENHRPLIFLDHFHAEANGHGECEYEEDVGADHEDVSADSQVARHRL
jgi:hypothetical protein